MSPASVVKNHGAAPSVRRRLVVALLGAMMLLALAQLTGLLELVRDEVRLAEAVEGAGMFGPLLLIVLMTVLIPLGVPGVPFVLAAGVLWAWPIAASASLVGGVTSSTIGMLAARRVGRETLQSRLPRWLQGVDQRLTASGLLGVIVLRLVLYLIAPADWVIGLSQVPRRTAIVGTAVGLAPATVAYVTVGPDFFRWLVTPLGLASSLLGIAVVWLLLLRSSSEPTQQA
ncbi:MAG: putative membrane protein YdjX (TVP38/TMEM64 family) [Glaciecola sp.]